MIRIIEHEKAPRWISVPSLVGSLSVFPLMALYRLPEGAVIYVAWAIVVVPIIAMGVLMRSWRRRRPITAHELEYLRLGIGLLSLIGLGGLSGGAWPLTLVAGLACWIWTIVERRRSSQQRS